jgi:outer membrane murein-binding lipoprotein Lpp
MPIALVGAAVAAAGSVAAGSMKANAARKAGNKQVSALEAQLQSLESDLNTDSMNQRALEADDRNIQQRLDLQAKYDPALRDLRTAGSDKLLGIVNNLGNNASDRVAAQLEKEALPQDMGLEDLRKRFIVTANEELDAGGMLTPDVQAEIARAGLEVGGTCHGQPRLWFQQEHQPSASR